MFLQSMFVRRKDKGQGQLAPKAMFNLFYTNLISDAVDKALVRDGRSDCVCVRHLLRMVWPMLALRDGVLSQQTNNNLCLYFLAISVLYK